MPSINPGSRPNSPTSPTIPAGKLAGSATPVVPPQTSVSSSNANLPSRPLSNPKSKGPFRNLLPGNVAPALQEAQELKNNAENAVRTMWDTFMAAHLKVYADKVMTNDYDHKDFDDAFTTLSPQTFAQAQNDCRKALTLIETTHANLHPSVSAPSGKLKKSIEENLSSISTKEKLADTLTNFGKGFHSYANMSYINAERKRLHSIVMEYVAIKGQRYPSIEKMKALRHTINENKAFLKRLDKEAEQFPSTETEKMLDNAINHLKLFDPATKLFTTAKDALDLSDFGFRNKIRTVGDLFPVPVQSMAMMVSTLAKRQQIDMYIRHSEDESAQLFLAQPGKCNDKNLARQQAALSKLDEVIRDYEDYDRTITRAKACIERMLRESDGNAVCKEQLDICYEQILANQNQQISSLLKKARISMAFLPSNKENRVLRNQFHQSDQNLATTMDILSACSKKTWDEDKGFNKIGKYEEERYAILEEMQLRFDSFQSHYENYLTQEFEAQANDFPQRQMHIDILKSVANEIGKLNQIVQAEMARDIYDDLEVTSATRKEMLEFIQNKTREAQKPALQKDMPDLSWIEASPTPPSNTAPAKRKKKGTGNTQSSVGSSAQSQAGSVAGTVKTASTVKLGDAKNAMMKLNAELNSLHQDIEKYRKAADEAENDPAKTHMDIENALGWAASDTAQKAEKIREYVNTYKNVTLPPDVRKTVDSYKADVVRLLAEAESLKAEGANRATKKIIGVFVETPTLPQFNYLSSQDSQRPIDERRLQYSRPPADFMAPNQSWDNQPRDPAKRHRIEKCRVDLTGFPDVHLPEDAHEVNVHVKYHRMTGEMISISFKNQRQEAHGSRQATEEEEKEIIHHDYVPLNNSIGRKFLANLNRTLLEAGLALLPERIEREKDRIPPY
jgi:outer membrane murein-binding lipoprotein Lpp